MLKSFYKSPVVMKHIKVINTIDNEQLKIVNQFFKEILKSNKFYQEKYKNYSKSNFKGIIVQKDFFSLPFTTRNELIKDQQLNPPYGTNLTYQQKDYDFMKSTSGSTGNKLHTPFTPKDFLEKNRILNKVFKIIINPKPNERIICWTTAGATHYMSNSLTNIGYQVIALDGYENSEDILNKIIFFKVETLWTTPVKIFLLMEYIQSKKINPKTLPLKNIISIAEGYLENPITKKLIKKYLNSDHFSTAGSTECGHFVQECKFQQGNHLINEGYIYEVINPKTLKHDTKGELVLTTLWRKGFPFIRYRTGDYVEIDNNPCPCGYPTPRTKPASLRRYDDYYSINNQGFSSAQFDENLRTYIGTNNYFVKILKKEVIIKIESNKLSQNKINKLRSFLSNNFKFKFRIKLIKNSDQYLEGKWKINRIYDARNKPNPTPYNKFVIKTINIFQNLLNKNTTLHPW